MDRTYRGLSWPEVTRLYHAEALRLAGQGYVPVDERWAEGLGSHIATVTYEYRPHEVDEVLRLLASPVARAVSPGRDAASTGTTPLLRDRVAHYVARGYVVVSYSSTRAELAKPMSGLSFHSKPDRGALRDSDRESTIYLMVTATNDVVEWGSGLDTEPTASSTTRRARVAMAMLVALLAVVLVVAIAFAWTAGAVT